MDSLIQFKDVTKCYFKKDKELAGISNLSFDVFKEEIISIVGPSGCGKTTILRLMSNVILQDSGKILYDNEDISIARKAGLIGLVPQSPTLLPNRTVRANIRLPLEIKSIDDDARISNFVRLMGLQGFEDFYPFQLSGGMKQRVSIARALICDPKFLLMDEPFSALDEILRERLNLEVRKIQQKLKQTIVFVTHNIEEAVFISDRIILMSHCPGRIIAEKKIKLPEKRDSALKEKEIFFEQLRNIRKILKTSLL